MKVSRTWLQKYFDTPLPDTEALSDLFTFHSCEVEEVVGDMLDVKVLPDRAAYALCHRGVAYELAAARGEPLAHDPLRTPLILPEATDRLSVSIENTDDCPRYTAALVTGVTVTASPAWLVAALESVGQRSINNIVDATNYVMLNIGQPLHAFDAAKITSENDTYAIRVRSARSGETTTTLTGEKYDLPEGTLLITDATSDTILGIAGVKGGAAAAITESTTDIILESANFNGTRIRKTSQALKLWTDASLRYQNKIAPLLSAYGMRDVLALILEVAGADAVVVGSSEINSVPHLEQTVTVTLEKIQSVLGIACSHEEVEGVFTRFGLSYKTEGSIFIVTVPFERRDLSIPEDLIEEVGRTLGYDRVLPTPLPPVAVAPDQARHRGIERIKDFMVMLGFTEISTQTFAAKGDTVLANPLDQTKPALRTTLVENMSSALTHAASVAPRVLGPDSFIKLFEVGTVFENGFEHLSLSFGYKQVSGKKTAALLAEVSSALSDEFGMHISIKEECIAEVDLSGVSLETLGSEYQPKRTTLGAYQPFSIYPSAVRDIAVWTPLETEESEVLTVLIQEAGELLARVDQFDRYIKDDKLSYAFRLVFQSRERTLADADLDPVLRKISDALNHKEGFAVR